MILHGLATLNGLPAFTCKLKHLRDKLRLLTRCMMPANPSQSVNKSVTRLRSLMELLVLRILRNWRISESCMRRSALKNLRPKDLKIKYRIEELRIKIPVHVYF